MGLALTDADIAPETEGLWPWHLPGLRAFLAVATQWRVAGGIGGAVRIGLDYAAAEAGLRLAGIEVTPDLWDEVCLIEAGALEVRQ